MLREIGLSVTMTDMKKVTLRSLLRDSALFDRAAHGEQILVTRFGKPYVRIIPAEQPMTFLGAGKHLGQKKAVSPEPIPSSEWKGLD
jgi:antitoxin (DNA-binding transcriptional repressor) of toxin-antitoxin stability system